jgi:hypothetical protein
MIPLASKNLMNTTTPTINRILLALCGAAFAVPAIFFAYYTLRLIYINVMVSAEEAAAHRTGGMLIGAVVFPIASLAFALLSWFCFRNVRRGITDK